LRTPSNITDVILPHEDNYNITLEVLETDTHDHTDRICMVATKQFLRSRAMKMKVLLISQDTLLAQWTETFLVLAHEANFQCLWAACGSPS
jgi:hypothetical protein